MNQDIYSLASLLGLKKAGYGPNFTGQCPSCGYKSGFSLSEKNGKLLYYCFAGGCTGNEIRTALTDGLGTEKPDSCNDYFSSLAEPCVAPDAKQRRFIDDLILNSQSLTNTPVECYLKQRNIAGITPLSLRYLANCRHRPTNTDHPAMLGLVQLACSDEVIGLHRTYLTNDGQKAAIEPNKMSIGPIRGASVKLAPAGKVLAITEGIETGLSIQLATGIPTWAALSAAGMKQLVLPPMPLAAEVIICADNDSVGLQAAETAAKMALRRAKGLYRSAT